MKNRMRHRMHRYLESLCAEHCRLEPNARRLPNWLFKVVSFLEHRLRPKPYKSYAAHK